MMTAVLKSPFSTSTGIYPAEILAEGIPQRVILEVELHDNRAAFALGRKPQPGGGYCGQAKCGLPLISWTTRTASL